MDPIKLTIYGETLLQYPDSKESDETLVTPGCIGVHDICRGWVDLYEVSKTHYALKCRRCGLRVVFSKSIKTMGDLRRELDPDYAAKLIRGEVAPTKARVIQNE